MNTSECHLQLIARCLTVAFALVYAFPCAAVADNAKVFNQTIRPLLKKYCVTCHSSEKHKGDLDLERFTNDETVRTETKIWQQVEEQLQLGEMPPKEKPQLPAAQKARLLTWVRDTLADLARKHAGDPGPVVLRRLSNAEYTYTARDLTGIKSLHPAREFPADGAAGEGFSNAGAALVMSPALFTKYLDAAKGIAGHAVLLPDGIAFSEKTTRRDWTEEKLAAIRAFYSRFTENGGGKAVNLQGIKFDTKDGGVLPLEKYFAATISEREALSTGHKTIGSVAHAHGLNARYFATLWKTLNDAEPSLVLDVVRAQWREAKPDAASALAATVRRWQQAFWRFTSVGHIGKRDGPKAWQLPVLPLAVEREVRVKLPELTKGDGVKLYLVASDAGDGKANDHVIWTQPRIVFTNRPPIRLMDLQSFGKHIEAVQVRELDRTGDYLGALAEAQTTGQPVENLADKRNLNKALLANWSSVVRLGHSATPAPTGHFTRKLSKIGGYAEIRGWGSERTPSLVANRANNAISFSTLTVPGRGVTVHPSPDKAAVVYWRSPIAGKIRLAGLVADADNKCGNGIEWNVEIVTRNGVSPIADGAIDNGGRQKFKRDAELAVQPGDLVKLAVSPRGRQHVCDTTHIELTVTEVGGKGRAWDLARDIVDRIHDGNPLADSFGNPDTWHFCASTEKASAREDIPPESRLAVWRDAVANGKSKDDVRNALQAVAEILKSGEGRFSGNDADRGLRQRLLRWRGPLDWLSISLATRVAGEGSSDIEATAPSVLEFNIPAQLAAGAEFVSTGSLHPEKGREGSVQMQALLTRPASNAGLTVGAVKAQGRRRLWSDGVLPVASDAPILVTENSETRARILSDIQAFRAIFPAALCYTKIVPVDEVVTLTLYYREDEHLRRLMLDATQAAELDRLWSELHFVSHDALKLVDAFEQLWQFATQDADPSAFTPMREPIQQRAARFRETLIAAEPLHLNGVLKFAERAWRRQLTGGDKEKLRSVYHQLRQRELSHDAAIRTTLARVLVAPDYLYKLETPPPGKAQSPVTDPELATRLSYFLWSTAPDAKLTALAAGGKLSDPNVLGAQTRRMLQHENVRRIAIEFGSQWLHTRDFDQLDEKSERHFPTFKVIREAMNEEPIRFFIDLFQRDGSVLDLLEADYAFVNADLAKHYGLPNVSGEEWRRVDGVRAQGRGGILAFGATLARQSGASRTSPILRGNWVYETLLGERLPRPPKGVPVLPEEPPAGLTERALIEQHSRNPDCARCHVRIDPFGFALEGYDAIGRRRTKDAAGMVIDARTRADDRTGIEGIDGLRNYLLTKRCDQFVRQFCRKLLGYALGRGVLLSDEPLLDSMLLELAENNYRIGTVFEMIVQSRQFRDIRGKDMTGRE